MKYSLLIASLFAFLGTAEAASVVRAKNSKIVVKRADGERLRRGQEVKFINALQEEVAVGTVIRSKGKLSLVSLKKGYTSVGHRAVASTGTVGTSRSVVSKLKKDDRRDNPHSISLTLDNREIKKVIENGEEQEFADSDVEDIAKYRGLKATYGYKINLGEGFFTTSSARAGFTGQRMDFESSDAKVEQFWLSLGGMQKLGYNVRTDSIDIAPYIGAGIDYSSLKLDYSDDNSTQSNYEDKYTGYSTVLEAGAEMTFQSGFMLTASYAKETFKVNKYTTTDENESEASIEEKNNSDQKVKSDILSFGVGYKF